MDTLLVIRDSVSACVRNTSDLCQPSIETGFTGISWQEVVALAIILLFIISILWLLFKYQIITKKKTVIGNADKENNNKEKELAKLKDMLYKHLQTRVYIDKCDTAGHKIKEYSNDNDKEYIKQLRDDITELATK